ncbi:MAG TPA: DUF2812 domain-containing protein [Clostridiaceae bacterium]|nr:DUF2812 domain-containing protein [Clostridiaceae bacterium]
MSKFRLNNGVALFPEKDCRMMAEMSAKGWHLVSFAAGGLLYRFEKGNPEDYQYVFYFEKTTSREMMSIFEAAGWQLVAGESGIQIFRAGREAIPIYSEPETKIEMLKKSKERFAIMTMFAGMLLLSSLISAIWVYPDSMIMKMVLLIVWSVFVFSSFPLVGLTRRIKDLRNQEGNR